MASMVHASFLPKRLSTESQFNREYSVAMCSSYFGFFLKNFVCVLNFGHHLGATMKK